MKYYTRFIKKLSALIIPFCLLAFSQSTFALPKKDVLLPSNTLEDYGLNNVLFYESECVPTDNFMVCGENAKEKYWSVISQYFDEIHTAAIMGNLAHEGVFSPTRWQKTMLDSANKLTHSWASLYNCGSGNCPGGVGAFQITYRLGQYLQFIDTKETSLLAYFQKSDEYSLPGDELLEEIDEEDYDKLVQLEVEFVLSILRNSDEFKATTTIEDATDWWTKSFENCANCCGAADADQSCESLEPRRASAKKIYEEFKDFDCGASANLISITETQSTKITLIGDSIALSVSGELASRFPSSFITKTAGRSFTKGGKCAGDAGGYTVLKGLINNMGPIISESADGMCESFQINPYTSLQDNIVWEIGTNTEGANKKNLDKLLELADDYTLFLVTPYNQNDMANTDKVAELYREAAEGNSHVFVIDWNQKVRDNPSVYIDADGVTPSETGKTIYVNLIAEEVSKSRGCATVKDGEWPDYQQCDPRWAKEPYGGGTFCSCSCGCSSMAMLASAATGQDITPPDIYNTILECYAKGNCPISGVRVYYHTGSGDLGRFLEMDSYVGQVYGFDAVAVAVGGEGPAKMKEYLDQGYMLHFSGAGDAPFSTIGHYVGIFALNDDGTVALANSCRATGGYNKTLEQINAANNRRYTPLNFIAIRGNGRNCGSNLCKDRDEKAGTSSNEGSGNNSSNGNNSSGNNSNSTAGINPYANKSRLKKLFPNGIPTGAGGMGSYNSTITVTVVDKKCKKSTKKVRVHKDLASAVQEIFEEMAAICFPVRTIGGQYWKTNEKGEPSAHAYGAAIDINPGENKYICGKNPTPDSNPYKITDKVARIWAKHGYTWGGTWRNCQDYMHFSYLGY